MPDLDRGSDIQIDELAIAAGVPVELARHHAPLLRLIAAMTDARAEPAQVPTVVDGSASHLHRCYTRRQAAEFLGYADVSALDAIPEADLPRQRVGEGRRSVRYYGLDLLCYLKRIPPPDYPSLVAAALPPGTEDAEGDGLPAPGVRPSARVRAMPPARPLPRAERTASTRQRIV